VAKGLPLLVAVLAYMLPRGAGSGADTNLHAVQDSGLHALHGLHGAGGAASMQSYAGAHGSLDSEGRQLQQVKTARPKIYMYQLSDFWRNWTKFGDISDSFYGLDQLFPELLGASPYLTNNTNEADYFYVHVWMYWRNDGFETKNLIKEMQAQGPWWDRKGGADHIFVISADQARCEWWAADYSLKKAIVIHHFGRVVGRLGSGCSLDGIQWGLDCDAEIRAGEAAYRGYELQSCHYPGQDIVVPPPPFEPHPSQHKKHTWPFKTHYIHKELGSGKNRTNLLFYSGKIDLDAGKPGDEDNPWRDAAYSFGARQTLYRMFSNSSAFALHSKHTVETYWQHLTSSIFCLAAAGWGWGGRMKVAVTRGCIPLIVQDGILVEWEEQLPLKEYAIRVPMWMAHKTPDILQAFIQTGRAANMSAALDCVWRLHWWRRPEGRAFEMTMCELKRRLLAKQHGVEVKIKLDIQGCRVSCGDPLEWWQINGPDDQAVVV